MPSVKKRKNLQSEKKLNIRFDIPMLNSLIKYIQCEYTTNAQLLNVQSLVGSVDVNQYNYNYDIQIRLIFLSVYLDAKIENNLHDKSIIMSYIADKNQDAFKAAEDNNLFEANALSTSECSYIAKSINDRLQSLYIYEVKDDIISILEKVNDTSLVSYHNVIEELKDRVSKLLVKLQETEASDDFIKSFSFADDTYAMMLDKIVTKAKRPSSILQTGIRQLNAILSPGFHSGRLYTFLGGTGRFKSGTLMNIADQIRRYNPQIMPYENGKRKTILYLTLEDSIEESVTKLFDMYSDVDDHIMDRSTKEVMEILKENGKFSFNDKEGIDITFQYYSNMQLKTSDIYSIVKDLSDHNKEVIAIIVDYVLLIDSAADHHGDERMRLSHTTFELKAMSKHFNIPIITAMQLNREGNSILDAAMRDNKQDVAKFIGASSVGASWNVIQNSDWVGFINPELQKSTNIIYLTFKRLKIKYKKDPFALDYFNHPFINEKNIRLADDIYLDQSLSIASLASDLESINEKEFDRANNARNTRPKISSIKADNLIQAIDTSTFSSRK